MDCNHFPPRQSVDVNQMLTHLLAIPKVQTPLIMLQILAYFTLTLLQKYGILPLTLLQKPN